MTSLLDRLTAATRTVVDDAKKKAIRDLVVAVLVGYVLIESTKDL